MRPTAGLAFVVLLAATATGVAGELPAPSFTLGLERCDLTTSGAFHPVADEALAAPAAATADPSPVTPDLALSLTWTPADDRVPDGLRMSFKQRTWDDLDGWEKTGYVLAQTSAAAGVAYLLYRLVD